MTHIYKKYTIFWKFIRNKLLYKFKLKSNILNIFNIKIYKSLLSIYIRYFIYKN